MKNSLRIFKGLGLILLFSVLVGMVAASDGIHTSSVTISQSISPDITNTYNKESGAPDIYVIGIVSGNSASITTNAEDTKTVDTKTPDTKTTDPGVMPIFQHGMTFEGFSDELWGWFLFSLDDNSPLATIDYFPQE